MTGTEGSETVLRLDDVRIAYDGRGDRVEVVHGVSLSLRSGEFVAVVGESGSGKSTLAHAILGLLASNGRVVGGTIRVGDDDVTRWSDRQFGHIRGLRIGLVPQDPTISLNPVKRIGDQVAETIRLHGTSTRRQAADDAVRALADAGLPDPGVRAAQYPHELSGGMRQRALIANAWACHPQIVIADEPTSALDVTVQKQVLDRLDTIRAERSTAVLFITHDLAIALERADRIVVMHDGNVVDEGTPAELVAREHGTYTRGLLESSPGLRARSLSPSPGVPERAPVAIDVAAPVLEAVGLRKEYRLPGGSRVVAVEGLDLALHRGETLALVGESGSGKTTSARLLAGLVPPSGGVVLRDGVESTAQTPATRQDWRHRMQFVYQSPFASLNPRLTVERIVSEPLRAARVGTRATRAARVRQLIDLVALPASVIDRRPGALSGGQRQRVAIARAVALRPELLVLDEPVSALDASVQAQILQLLVDLRAEFGLTYLFISHDLAVVRQIADRVAVMSAGTLVEIGTTEEVFTRPQHDYTRRLLASIPKPAAVADAWH